MRKMPNFFKPVIIIFFLILVGMVLWPMFLRNPSEVTFFNADGVKRVSEQQSQINTEETESPDSTIDNGGESSDDQVSYDGNSGENTGELFTVTNVVDGDTIDVSGGGIRERVRLLGINTPETVDPRKEVECFGREAKARTKELLLGEIVYLEGDLLQSDRDKYGRLLRYVFAEDGTNVNLLLVREGYAYEYTYGYLPYKYQKDFKNAQKEAQADGVGLWAEGVCD